MTTAPHAQNDQPDAEAIRAQVERMTKSSVFANSPQLSAFLLFVVEATLRGKSERLKGYTIGVEVLRRDVTFDPQLDPIVRVEATRLRRAIERYYAAPGANDAIMISLPRGGYVPRIAWRAQTPVEVAAPEPEILAPGNGMPILRVAPFVVTGSPSRLAIDGETLSSKLCEALALFDTINVVAASPADGRYDYRLDGTVEYRDDLSFRFRLVDKAHETVVWSRAFEEAASENAAEIERKIIIAVANAVVQRFGIIWSQDHARHIAANAGDPRYRAVIQAGEALRSFDATASARARQELERLTATDPSFSAGFSYLAILCALDYVHGFGEAADDAAALDQALKLARRGIELKPQSAFAYHILFVILFLRGETEAASAAAENAISLNPYNIGMLADYGGRLIFAGEVDKGMEILRRILSFGAILPAWMHLYLFLGHYLRDEFAEARFHAGQLTNEMHVYGQVARALMAYRDGQTEEARRTIQAILASHPRWKADPRREIGKLITGSAIADRLASELADAGLT